MRLKIPWGMVISTAVLLTAVPGCINPRPVRPPLTAETVSTMTGDTLTTRMKWDSTGCLRASQSALKLNNLLHAKSLIDECQGIASSNEMKLLGTKIAAEHPDWPGQLRQNLQRGMPFGIGMSKEQALLLMGKPDDNNVSLTKSGSYEQWVYRISNARIYLYFDDGRVSTIQF